MQGHQQDKQSLLTSPFDLIILSDDDETKIILNSYRDLVGAFTLDMF